MVALAVALGPRRLVVAGIDLFGDARGAYPGDSSTPNAYGMFHSRAAEQAAIVGLLRHYPGELVVVGNVLRQALSLPPA